MLAKVWDVFMEYKNVAARRWVAAFLACGGVMTMGDVVKIGDAQHLITAATTGILATLIIIGALVVSKNALRDKGSKEAGLIFISTVVADFVVHAQHFDGESLVTGGVALAIAAGISKLNSSVA